MPGEYAIINPTDKQDTVIWAQKVGEANGYEPPPFPRDAVEETEER